MNPISPMLRGLVYYGRYIVLLQTSTSALSTRLWLPNSPVPTQQSTWSTFQLWPTAECTQTIFKCEPCELWWLGRNGSTEHQKFGILKACIKYSFSHSETCSNKMENYRLKPCYAMSAYSLNMLHRTLTVAQCNKATNYYEEYKVEKYVAFFWVSDYVWNIVKCYLIHFNWANSVEYQVMFLLQTFSKCLL